MIEKNVVSCFLEYKGKILIARRSSKVGTYQGRWAGISGYLEKDSYRTALNELQEEVNLTAEDVKLIKEGEVLQVPDEKLNILWNVHPFLFRCKSPEKIKLDWEHKEYRWVDPREISKYETVPKLKEAFERVKVNK